MRKPDLRYFLISVAVLGLAACGDYTTGTQLSGGAGGGSASVKNCDELFTQRVQPKLEFCRNCHVPNGVGDVEDGKLFMLSTNSANDWVDLQASWERLGGAGGEGERILKMPSGTDTHTHSGGTPWPVGSDAYKSMQAQLLGFADPKACALSGLGEVVEELPLLGSKRGGHVWFDFCEGQPDDAVLPVDPRSLVQPGVSDGKAVYFNAYWKDCHVDPELVGERAQPKNCGELRAAAERGKTLVKGNGAVGAGTFFAGTEPDGYITVPVSAYNNLWQLWGLSSRPDNFDQLVAERFGGGMGPERNPYPLPGEDPNLTEGGSGQLPTGVTQTRDAEGRYTSILGLTCNGCHSGQVGTPEDGPGLGALYGSGNSLVDVSLIARELATSSLSPVAIFSLFSKSRGTNNASDVNVFFLINQDAGFRLDAQTLGLLTSGSTASGDTPAWWNMGHRPLKFQDGYFAMDASRVDLVFFQPILDKKPAPSTGDQANAWVREHAQDADRWFMSLKSPAWPETALGVIDTALAERGAILFHSKNLWADNLENPVPKPEGGNGSCASCHGVYSPRYANDSAYLDTPALEGVAGYVVPKNVIRTDPARVDTNNDAVGEYGATSFLGYSETVGSEQDCGPQNRPSVRGSRQHGYLAPPLYGIWATAPYLHNGAVPNVWELLKPADRKPIWRRVSTPARADQAGKVVMGFDTNLQRAYEVDKIGWKYEALSCGTGSLPFIECDPLDANTDPVLEQVLSLIYGNVLLSWNIGNVTALLQLTPQQIEDRKIYNTRLFSQGNEGHDFTAVLTDAERQALIEYLKTL